MRKLGEHAASIPEEVNTVGSIPVLLATDLHDIDIGVDMRNVHLFRYSKLVKVVGKIIKIKVVHCRV